MPLVTPMYMCIVLQVLKVFLILGAFSVISYCIPLFIVMIKQGMFMWVIFAFFTWMPCGKTWGSWSHIKGLTVLLVQFFSGRFSYCKQTKKNNGNISCLFFVSTESQLAFFRASFETNPLDGKCDQRAEVSSQPVQVIYDAVSINL